MDVPILERHFAQIGAKSQFVEPRLGERVRLDVRARNGVETFIVEGPKDAQVRAVDVRPRERHLLLLHVSEQGEKNKFLCGHDERHWFVAAVPGRGVSNVATAMEALKPLSVRNAQNKVRPRDRNRRRNKAFIRQGEWFFVPAPNFEPRDAIIWPNEPIVRGGGKPHICEELCRIGGERVYVAPGYANPLREVEYQRLLREHPTLRNQRWEVRVRDPHVFVRGRVRHRDHATVHLNGWHHLAMNTETQAPSMRHVAFID